MISIEELSPLESGMYELDYWFLALETAARELDQEVRDGFVLWYLDLSEWAGAPMNPGLSHEEVDAINGWDCRFCGAKFKEPCASTCTEK